MPPCSTCGYAVEWLRSCYGVHRLLYRGRPDVTCKGYYYFNDQAPHLFQIHNYGSLNWQRGEIDEQPPLGEVIDAARPYRNGMAPARLPLPRVLGGADCLSEGASLPLPPIDREIIDGIDSRCFAQVLPDPGPPGCALDAPALQAAYARCLELTYDEDLLVVKDALAAWYGAPTQLWALGAAGLIPARSYHRLPDGSLLAIISGSTTPQQVATQAFSGLLGPTNYGMYSTLATWNHTASWLTTEMSAHGFDAVSPVTVVGHSYGAALAALLAARWKLWNPDRHVCVLTYGTPKIGDARTVNFVASTRNFHIATAEDVVTALPPDLRELLPFSALLPFGLAAAWASWRTYSSYLVVKDGGAAAMGDPPYLDSGLLGPLLADVLAGDPLPAFNAHLIETYVARLKARQPVAAWPVPAVAWNILFP